MCKLHELHKPWWTLDISSQVLDAEVQGLELWQCPVQRFRRLRPVGATTTFPTIVEVKFNWNTMVKLHVKFAWNICYTVTSQYHATKNPVSTSVLLVACRIDLKSWSLQKNHFPVARIFGLNIVGWYSMHPNDVLSCFSGRVHRFLPLLLDRSCSFGCSTRSHPYKVSFAFFPS